MGIKSHGDIVGYSFTSPGGAQTVRAFLRPASGCLYNCKTQTGNSFEKGFNNGIFFNARRK
jgi:hypothetical protein